MGKIRARYKKAELPSKACARCLLPFSWRKKWERDWEQVKYCSERCRRAGGAAFERHARFNLEAILANHIARLNEIGPVGGDLVVVAAVLPGRQHSGATQAGTEKKNCARWCAQVHFCLHHGGCLAVANGG